MSKLDSKALIAQAQRLRDTAQMSGQFPEWLLREIDGAADSIEKLAGNVGAEPASVYRCDFCGGDYTHENLCCESRREYLSAHAPQQPVALPDGWRVMRATGSLLRKGDRWEIYGPNGSGGIVSEQNVECPTVRKLLDALAARPIPPESVEVPRG